ncbi:MAG: ATP-dependent helicase [Planctomycetes bacterium]|nr:ATP-dependent helicase [Planctomycetota bacterium]
MSLSEISPISKQEELGVQALINYSIDNYENVVFNAGAGSGKTFALTESLKYIINKYGDKLMHHNQKIMCITYTNVATNEIKDRLGNSDIVKVSTIHERLWALIREHKKELVKIHIEKLHEELGRLRFDLIDNAEDKVEKRFRAYRKLSEGLKDAFMTDLIASKDIFYKYYDKPAKEFKGAFGESLYQYPNILNNVANFKKTVNTIYKIDKFEYCLKQIGLGSPNFTEVRYEDKYNTDILHRMLISHDTLLEYSLKIVKTYDLLKRLIFDSYPYILIDEYQDTNKSVIHIMKLIDEHAKSIQRKLFIGYFGDTAQNIYEDGVGSELTNIHPGLKKIDKQFNRRSHSEIIDVINKIRNDHIKQKSIFADCTGGSLKFYTGTDEFKHDFINKYKIKWKINSENKLHCLVLLNKFVAEFNEFPAIYKHFSDTAFYKKNYDRLNTELLSNDPSKLGSIPSLFYRISQFIFNIGNSETSLSSLIDKKIYSKMTFLKLKELIALLKTIKGDSLGEYIENIFEKYDSSGNSHYRQVIAELINIEGCTYQNFINYLLDELFLNVGSGKTLDFKLKLKDLFDEELFSKADQKELDEFKGIFEKLLEDDFFSYIDIDEVNSFKLKLHKVINDDELLIIENAGREALTAKVDKLFDHEIYSIIDIDEVESAKTKLCELLSVDIHQWILWYEFIEDEQKADIIYHTYHGTKGAEFDNVIIIMENDFGRMNRNKFSSFFEHYNDSTSLDMEDNLKFNNTKNLLYVSCSRAIKNLRILYLDDVTEFKDGIKSIFGEICQYGRS